MCTKSNVPQIKTIVNTMNPIETSYETIWAVDRKAPKNAYFELLDQPDSIIPYTPNDEIAKMYRRLKFNSAITEYFENGITPHPNKLITNVKMGEAINKNLFELLGITLSLISNLNPSASGCRSPYAPTTLGPLRRWNAASTFRSTSVK